MDTVIRIIDRELGLDIINQIFESVMGNNNTVTRRFPEKMDYRCRRYTVGDREWLLKAKKKSGQLVLSTKIEIYHETSFDQSSRDGLVGHGVNEIYSHYNFTIIALPLRSQ